MNLSLDNLFILIPARNEAENLPFLLRKIKNEITSNIVVVDNNSSDNTFTIAKFYTQYVIKEKNPGYGNACLTGIQFINSLQIKPKAICFFDGDGQSQIEDIIRISQQVLDSEHIHYCQGTRMVRQSSKQSLTGSAYVANKVFATILTILWKQKVSDLGPLRCIDLKLLNDLQMKSKTFAWTIEMNTKLLKKGEIIKEISVDYIPRKFGKSKISGNFKTSIKAAVIMSITFLKTALFWRITIE